MLLAIPAGVEAATYTNTAHHYHFTAPDGWNESTPSTSGDVQYSGPVTGLTTANIIFGAQTCTTAVNTEAFLLASAKGSHDGFKAILGGTTQGEPRTFTTSAGRMAADWSVNYTIFIIEQRVRQVIFVSDGYDLVFVATFTDNTSAFATNQPALDGIVNTFAVDSEPGGIPAPGGGSYGSMFSGTNLYIIIGVVVAVVVVAAVMMKRKGKGKEPAAQPPAPGAPPAPPAAPKK